MKTIRLLALVQLFLLAALPATAQSWRWSYSGGALNASLVYNDRELIRDMATDRNGNVYTISTIANTSINVAGQPVPLWPSQWPYYSLEVMINSFTCSGVLRWSKLIGCEMGKDIAYALRTDSADGVYAAMELDRASWPEGVLHVDYDSVISAYSHKRLYLVKYDTAGVHQWITGPEQDTVSNYSSLTDEWIDMDADAQGNLYCLAHLDTGAYGNGGTYVATSEGDYMLKYDKNGSLLGGTKLDANSFGSYSQTARLTRDPASGHYYISGWNADKIYVGNDSVVHSMYIVAFDKDGKYLWKRENAMHNTEYFSGRPLLDKDGNIYLSGSTAPGDNFNGYTIPTGGGPLIVKLDDTGKNIWARTAMVTGEYWPGGLCLRNSGEVVLASGAEYMHWPGLADTVTSTPYRLVLTRFNTHTGKVLGMDTTVATYSSITDGAYATAIAGGGSNSIYVGGSFGDTLAIGTTILSNSGGQDDFFIARYGYDACGCDTIPQPSFTSTLVTWNAYQFTYTGSQPFNSILWDFGDGITSTQLNPFHTFPGGKKLDVTVTVTNDCGDNTFGETFQTVGISEVETTPVSIYPNPATDKLSIAGAVPNSTVYLFDIAGRLHQTLVLDNGGSGIVATARLPAGQYLLRLSAVDGKSSLHKFIKQ